jgi:Flp pilus assembly pilin Flp
VPSVGGINRFIRDESAQDLVEYALLCAFIGLVSVLVWANIVTLLGLRYGEYNSNVQALWASPDP